jgi:chorismate mutase
MSDVFDFLHEKTPTIDDHAISADAVVKAATVKFSDLSMRLAEKEQELEDIKKELEGVNHQLVDLLVERGWTTLPLAGGRKLELKESVYARFPKEDRAAEKWLEDNGGGDMLKPSIVVDGRDETVIEALSSLGAEFTQKTDVNTNSLQAFFRRLLGQTKGSVRCIEPEEVPACFSLFEKKEVVLK